MSSDAEREAVAALHREALAALRRAVHRLGPEPRPAELPDAVEAEAAAGGGAPREVHDVAVLYLFGARVGGAAADDPEAAARWLTGWSRARARTPEDAHAALAAGIRFGERVHRAMGIEGGG